MTSNSLYILAILCCNVALSEWLARNTALRHLGSALVVIVLTALVANVGLIPAYDPQIPVYAGTFEYVAPLAIFLLLLRVNLRGLAQVGVPMLLLFLLGSTGTMAGVLLGMKVVGGSRVFGELHYALGGMFVGTYTGGSINFNAIAIEYGVAKDGLLYAGASVVDSVMTTLWMATCVALPRLLRHFAPQRAAAPVTLPEAGPGLEEDSEKVNPLELSLVLALALFAVWFSGWFSAELALWWKPVPSILILTTLALILAQLKPIQGLRGTKLCGMSAVLLFLAVIGALCDFSALRDIGDLGFHLMIFASVIVLVHGSIVFAAVVILRLDADMAAVASQANIGGSTSALALARSLGRADLVLPGILVGSLGNALGTYLGFATAEWLQ
ncbi:MAG: DUF819 family protein [Planctomycetota bacterium]